MLITRRLEFDAGHRIPNHKSQCRHMHGHRYAIEVTVSGDLVADTGNSAEGMVIDYSDIKRIVQRAIVTPWDHAFLVYCGDTVVVDFLRTLPQHKTVTLDTIPTAENLAIHAFKVLDLVIADTYGIRLRLERVRLYETPNNWADAICGQL